METWFHCVNSDFDNCIMMYEMYFEAMTRAIQLKQVELKLKMVQTLCRWRRLHRCGCYYCEQANHSALNSILIWFNCSFIQGLQPSPLGNQTIPRRSFPEPAWLRLMDRPVADWNSRLAAVNHWILRVDMGAARQMESRWKGKRMALRKRPSNCSLGHLW